MLLSYVCVGTAHLKRMLFCMYTAEGKCIFIVTTSSSSSSSSSSSFVRTLQEVKTYKERVFRPSVRPHMLYQKLWMDLRVD
jgi:hypothetical protein